MPKTPGYRKRHDRNQAIVTLTDAVTKQRRDYWLGEPGSPESRELYHRVIAEWEAEHGIQGNRIDELDRNCSRGLLDTQITENSNEAEWTTARTPEANGDSG